MFPETRPSFNVAAVTEFLISEFPRHAILFRSLNHVTNGPMIEALRRSEYSLAASRQVYLYDGARPAFLKHKNTGRDLKLLQNTSLQRLEHHDFNDSHDARVKELYDLLYIEKYSKHNPQFTKQMIRLWRESGTMHLFGLMSNGQLCAVAGTFAMDNVITGPLIGYDTSRSTSAGLYRLLMAYTFQRALDGGLLLNLSAGAASFKRLRGGQPALEYSAVYYRHLSLRQRTMWKSLALLLEQVGARILRRYKL